MPEPKLPPVPPPDPDPEDPYPDPVGPNPDAPGPDVNNPQIDPKRDPKPLRLKREAVSSTRMPSPTASGHVTAFVFGAETVALPRLFQRWRDVRHMDCIAGLVYCA